MYDKSMSTTTLHRFQVATRAATRAKGKRDRVWTIDAATADEALHDALENHLRLLAGPSGYLFAGDVTETLELVDGEAPVNCEHEHDRRMGGFVYRWDGGKDCRQCHARLEDTAAAVGAALADRCGTCDNWGWVKARPADPYCLTEDPCPECVTAGRMEPVAQ